MDPNVKVTLLLEVFKRHTGVHVLKVFFAIICVVNWMVMTTKFSIVIGMIRKRKPQSQHSAPHLPQGSYGSPPSFRPFQKAQRARHLKIIARMGGVCKFGKLVLHQMLHCAYLHDASLWGRGIPDSSRSAYLLSVECFFLISKIDNFTTCSGGFDYMQMLFPHFQDW